MPVETVEPTAAPSPSSTPRLSRSGLYGGLVSSKQRRSGKEPGEIQRSADKPKSKKPLGLRTVLADAAELVRARKGRLLLGLLLMTVNRVCGLVLPGTTKFLLDEVIGKGNREMLTQILFVAGAATLIQGGFESASFFTRSAIELMVISRATNPLAPPVTVFAVRAFGFAFAASVR